MCNKTMKRNGVEKNYGFKEVFVQHSSEIFIVELVDKPLIIHSHCKIKKYSF